MNKNRKFEDILNLCFDRLLKGQSVEQCLTDYPEQARELEPLLRTFAAARLASQVKPRAEFKNQARYQFQVAVAEMSSKEVKPAARGWRWQSAWSIAIMAVLVVLVAGGGTVAAANNSMPDSALYSVKLATEQIRLTLTPTDLGKAEYNAELADRRVAEISYIASKGNGQEVQAIAMRLNSNYQNMAKLAGGENLAAGSGASQSTIMSAPSKAVGSLQAPGGANASTGTVPAVLPPTMAAMAPSPTQTIPAATTAAPTTRVPTTTTAAPTTTTVPASTTAGPTTPATAVPPATTSAPVTVTVTPPAASRTAQPAGAESSQATPSYGLDQSNQSVVFPPPANYGQENEKMKIAALLGQKALADIGKLNAVLAQVSPDVRPAIRQAIAQAQVEFDRAYQLWLAAQTAGS